MSSIVLELQQEALDNKSSIPGLLRKALVVARKLGQAEFQAWIENELNGYGNQDIPDYREVVGQVKAWNPFRGWIPVVFEDPHIARALSMRRSGQPISQLEHLINDRSKKKTISMPLPQEIQRDLCRESGFDTNVALLVSEASIAGVLDAVRTIVLNWALRLEEQGILGENLSFSLEEKKTAMSTPQNITNYYASVQNSNVQQGNAEAVQFIQAAPFDLAEVRTLVERLSAALPQLELPADKSAEVAAEITTLISQANSPNPKRNILSESLRSLRSILEGAAGSVAGQFLLDLGKLLGP